jgi:hypothetical protein
MKFENKTIANGSLAMLMIFFSLAIGSCKKEWLDVKPNKLLIVPSKITDFQAILDNNADQSLFNVNQPALGETGSDDYYVSYDSWQSFYLAQDRNAYIWSKDFYNGEPGFEWNTAYSRILAANIVLDGIEKISKTSGEEVAWNNVKGSALFFRSFDFFNLSQEFCKPYDKGSASVDPGIPLRLTSNINDKSTRASIDQCYKQLISDLKLAETLLPATQPVPTRPSKAAASGLLARVYLSMGDYNNSFLFADKSLNIYNQLQDFNDIDAGASPSLARFNKEVEFYSVLTIYDSNDCYSPRLNIDSNLYASYATNDLRKKVYFSTLNGVNTYNGYYFNDYGFFGGIATDEMYLIRAESNARLDRTAEAMNDLNSLLKTRWLTGSYIPFTAANSEEATNIVLRERRKELIFRGLRWSDLRRLNKESKYAGTLIRKLNGVTYSLPPNDPRYVLPIPDDEIRLSGIQQNER